MNESETQKRVAWSPELQRKYYKAVFLNSGDDNDADGVKVECILCKSQIKKNRTFNLTRHLRDCHRKEWETESEKAAVTNPTNRAADVTDYSPRRKQQPQKMVQTTLDQRIIVKNLTFQKVIDACVKLVTVNGRPFQILSDSGFREIIDPLVEAFPKTHRRSISPRTIHRYIQMKAKHLREEITKKLSNVPFSLKIDCASRKGRSFLGINAQVVEGKDIKVYTLAVREVFSSHTGANIKDMIVKVLRDYSLSEDQMLAITVDNGANMIKCVDLFTNPDMKMKKKKGTKRKRKTTRTNSGFDSAKCTRRSDANNPSSSYAYDHYDSDSDDVDDVGDEYDIVAIDVEVQEEEEDESDELSEEENENDVSEEEVLADLERERELLEMVFASVSTEFPKVTCVRCAAHTLQLAINDAIEVFKQDIEKIRTYVKHLRTPTLRSLLSLKGLGIPSLDCPTRWCSLYEMISSLLKLKTELQQMCDKSKKKNEDFFLEKECWDLATQLKSSLGPAFRATKKLQGEQLTLPDSYKIWMLAIRETENFSNDIASTLATHMRKRSRDVFGNGLYLAALSLDPRYVLDLSEEQLNIGIEFLLKVNEKILCLKRLNDNRERAAVLQDQNANGSTSTALTEAERLFEQELLKKRENRGMNTHDPLSSVLITDFAMHPPPLPLNASILEFWDSDTIKLQYPQLHTLAKVIMSVPATQVSVERTFSQLKYVLNDLRMRLKSENISDILLIRCNEKNLPTKCVYRLD